MKAFEVGKDERILFVFTHPDDELALASFIKRNNDGGVPVRIIWTHSTPVRKAESVAAMHSIGLQGSQMHFFSAPDGNVVSEVQTLEEPLRQIIAEFKPSRIVTHAFEQGHIDHDATNLLVNRCFDGPIFEAPFYHTYLTKFPCIYRFSSPVGEERIELTPSERREKKKLVHYFPSQTVKRNVVVYELAHAITLRKPPLFQYERMRLQTHKDYLAPNHPEPLASRVRRSATWKRWVAEVQKLQG